LIAAAVALPIVLVVGCASGRPDPAVWTLTRAGDRVESPRPGITAEEKAQLVNRPLGRGTYQLVGVADFVDAATSAKIGVRGAVVSPSRINATGMLAEGRRVAVKGILIDGTPAKINLTSVVDLGECR
jgi:hypothetical protein